MLTKDSKAIVVLSLLSPLLAELLSGSSPPLEFFHPFAFFFLWAYYGSGVILVREAWVRWGKGFMRLMLLGMAYGVYEEGLSIKSWFDPNWMDLDVFARYGRVAGVNTTWAVWLTIFHSIMSITAPIVVFCTIFPDQKDATLLSKKRLLITFFIFATSGFLAYFGLNPYTPPAIQYFLTVLLTISLVWTAKNLRKPLQLSHRIKHHVLYGFFISFLLFLNFTLLPHSEIPPMIPMILGLLLAFHFYSQLENSSLGGQYSVIYGFLSFWALPMAVIYELNGFLGMSAVGLSLFAGLTWLWKSQQERTMLIKS